MNKRIAKYLVDHRKEIEEDVKTLSDKAIVGAVRSGNTEEAKMIASFGEFFTGMLNIMDREVNPPQNKSKSEKPSRSVK